MGEMAAKSTTKTIKKDIRPTWDEYFMELVETTGRRATCDRGRSGCVIVKDKRILIDDFDAYEVMGFQLGRYYSPSEDTLEKMSGSSKKNVDSDKNSGIWKKGNKPWNYGKRKTTEGYIDSNRIKENA
jgi:hypothetical protein